MPKVFKQPPKKKPTKKKPKFSMTVRTYGNAPVCDCWINLHDGATTSWVLYGHKRRDKIEALIEQLGDSIEVEWENVEQWAGSKSNQKESDRLA